MSADGMNRIPVLACANLGNLTIVEFVYTIDPNLVKFTTNLAIIELGYYKRQTKDYQG